jgi:hypothetical protein
MTIKQLKELSQAVTTEQDNRILIYYYILYNKHVQVPHVLVAKINNKQLFETNVEIVKCYFKSFIDD